jgi:hypothetical protein
VGFFKTVRDVQALSAERGGAPSLRDAYNDIKSLSDDRGEREVLKNGTPTKAVVQGFTTPVPGDRFAMQIPLDVYPPGGGEPVRVNYVFPTARMQAPLSVGMEIPVKVDPADLTRIAVQWDAQRGAIAAAGGDAAAVSAGLMNTYSGAADAAMRQAMEAAAGVGTGGTGGVAGAGGVAGTGGPAGAGATPAIDPLERIAQLAKLRDSGAITEEEFAAKKAELLAQA